MSLYKNDEKGGIAASFGMFVVYLAGAILVWAAVSTVIDTLLLVAINPMVADGQVSVQTAHAIEWNINFIKYAVVLILLILFVSGLNWAIVIGSGGAPNTGAFWYGFVVFIICSFLGCLLALTGGLVIDNLIEQTATLPYQCSGTGDTGIGCQMQQDIYWFINYFYFICYVLPALGAALFFQSITARVGMSQYTGTGW